MKYVYFLDTENPGGNRIIDILSSGEEIKELHLMMSCNTKKFDPNEVALITCGKYKVFSHICGIGANSMDFHLCYELGRAVERNKRSGEHATGFVLFSDDHGYDPLIETLSKQGYDIKRVCAHCEAEAEKPEFRKKDPEKKALPTQKDALDAVASVGTEGRPSYNSVKGRVIRLLKEKGMQGFLVDQVAAAVYLSANEGKFAKGPMLNTLMTKYIGKNKAAEFFAGTTKSERKMLVKM